MSARVYEKLGVEITIYQSEADGTVVVEIDTPGLPEDSDGPRIRVNLNDGAIFENPPYPTGVRVP